MDGLSPDRPWDALPRSAETADAADRLFARAVAEFGPAIARIAYANEANRELRADLQQEIYFELWRSFAIFDGRCSLGTWVYRVAHNMAARHVTRRQRLSHRELCNLEEIIEPIDPHDAARQLDDEQRLGLLNTLIGQLKPLDRQIVLLYLDDLDTAQISEVTGLSMSHVGVKIHRAKRLLVQLYEGHQS
ncbi:RNA polymerase sigma factor [Peristeroidobacter agariperforans]|uniref:RNA polymerase sigma factor n=1 Tax=Peristeroidobacter agariperforans TaxID=268404 RepID=UPI00101DAC8B|nr:sigma-70 family RNA polymerase sigma factor [Peristeroidobacter agariperforans]